MRFERRLYTTFIGNEGGGSIGVVIGEKKFVAGRMGLLVRGRGTRASLEARPGVQPQEDSVLHSSRRDHTSTH